MPVKIRELISKAPTRTVYAWLKVLGPPFILLTVALTLLGTAIAFYQGYFNLTLFLLVLAGSACIHFGASCLNDYFDFLGGSDNINLTPTAYSGGSRVIQDGLLKPDDLLKAGTGLLGAGAAIGLALSVLCGWQVLLLGVAGMFLAVGYVEPHINLSAKGFGELAVVLGFGPLLVGGAYFAQVGHFDKVSLFSGLITGILAGLVLWINEIPDFEADDLTGKKNLVVRLGKRSSALIFIWLQPAAFALTLIGLLTDIFPLSVGLVFLCLPLSIRAGKVAYKHYNDLHKLLPANASAIALIIFFSLLMSFGFVLARGFR